MKAQRLLPLCSALFLGLAAAPAFAGSASVSNSFSIRDIYGGRSKTEVKIRELYVGVRAAGSDAKKVSVGYTKTNDGSTTTNYKEETRPKYCGWHKCGEVTTGSSTTTNNALFEEVDVSAATSSSWAREYGVFGKTTKIDVKETYNFNGIDKTHTVGSSFSF